MILLNENSKKLIRELRKYVVKTTKDTNIQGIFKKIIYNQSIKSGKKGSAEIKIPVLQFADFYSKIEEIDDISNTLTAFVSVR